MARGRSKHGGRLWPKENAQQPPSNDYGIRWLSLPKCLSGLPLPLPMARAAMSAGVAQGVTSFCSPWL